MPLKKKNKLRSRIIFWMMLGLILALMIYSPRPPSSGAMTEYELH